MLHARSNLFESAGMSLPPLTGGLHGPTARLPFPPTHLGRKNSICLARQDFLFRRGHHGSAVFHCILQPLTLHIFATTASAMVLSLLCNHWQFLLGFSAMAKQNQNPKKQKPRNPKNKKLKNKKSKMTRPNSLPLLPPLGVQIGRASCRERV